MSDSTLDNETVARKLFDAAIAMKRTPQPAGLCIARYYCTLMGIDPDPLEEAAREERVLSSPPRRRRAPKMTSEQKACLDDGGHYWLPVIPGERNVCEHCAFVGYTYKGA